MGADVLPWCPPPGDVATDDDDDRAASWFHAMESGARRRRRSVLALTGLPDDIMSLVFEHLEGRDLARIMSTCRAWHALSTRVYSPLWRTLYVHQFSDECRVDVFDARDNAKWRNSYRQNWWKRSWTEIKAARQQQDGDLLRSQQQAPTSMSTVAFLRIIFVCGLSSFVLVNVLMNLWNMQMIVGWHSFFLLLLWLIMCIVLIAASRIDVTTSWTHLLMFGGCSTTLCSVLLFFLRSILGPAIPAYIVLIPVISCGAFGLAMIASTVAFCRTPFVPASFRGSRAWLLEI